MPTLFGILQWETNYQFDGRNLLSKINTSRDSILTYYKPTTYPNFNDAEIYHVDYDSIIGRTKLNYIDTFNGYFSLEPSQVSASVKTNPIKNITANLTDNITEKGFENN